MARYLKGAAPARLALQVLIALCASWWLLYWFLQPIVPAYYHFINKIDNGVNSTFVGTYYYARTGGSSFALLFLPPVVIAFLSYFVLELRRRTKPSARYIERLWPIGVNMGIGSLIPFALLWIPVSRGSPFLRLIEVPFEHAVKHNIWLGSLAVWLATGHSVFLILYFVLSHTGSEVLTWYSQWVAYLPGVIAWVAGVFMLVTALDVVRRRFFDLFFRVHHLCLAYLIFFAFHSIYYIYYMSMLTVPVILFCLDRFIRFVQSRKAVDVLSAKVLPSGAMELRFVKPESLTYNALSFVHVLLPSVSRLEWHPFSVASSPLDGTTEISIYIKPLGGFTRNLHDALIASKHSESTDIGRPHYKCPFSFKVGLEGPYGDESSFYLRYQSLVMAAGGIGVTPFLAILRDILHRYRLGEDDLSTSVHIIFCCRRASELHIVDSLAPNTILPGYEEHLKIKFSTFITSKLPDGATEDDQARIEMASMDSPNYINVDDPRLQAKGSDRPVREMSPITSTGHNFWVGATVAATLVGFFVTMGIFNVTVLGPVSPNYSQVFILGLCMFLAVVPCGGGVMLLWAFILKQALRKLDPRVMTSHTSRVASPKCERKNDPEDIAPVEDSSLWKGNVIHGRRPNWIDTFNEVAIEYDGQNVGVLVSGAHKMQQEVARECKRVSLAKGCTIMLHYHSVSFEL